MVTARVEPVRIHDFQLPPALYKDMFGADVI